MDWALGRSHEQGRVRDKFVSLNSSGCEIPSGVLAHVTPIVHDASMLAMAQRSGRVHATNGNPSAQSDDGDAVFGDVAVAGAAGHLAALCR